MNYPRYYGVLKRRILNSRREGFILSSLVINVIISAVILILLLHVVYYVTVWDIKLRDDISMMGDGRFTRRLVAAHMMWNPAPANVRGNLLRISDKNGTTFLIQQRALYRRMSDGSLQPASGTRIGGTPDGRRVDILTTDPFTTSEYDAVHLHWFINNRFYRTAARAPGYGGIAGYEVCLWQANDFDWYKERR